MFQDLKFGVRMLLKRPWFTMVAALTLPSRSINAPGIVPPSRRRSGCSPAAPYPPALQIDCLQETRRKSTRGRALLIEFNLHRDLYRRGVKLLTINKERT
jgi:hypothetical protein